MTVIWSVKHFGSDYFNISTFFTWINIKFATDIHGGKIINPSEFGGPLTFSLY